MKKDKSKRPSAYKKPFPYNFNHPLSVFDARYDQIDYSKVIKLIREDCDGLASIINRYVFANGNDLKSILEYWLGYFGSNSAEDCGRFNENHCLLSTVSSSGPKEEVMKLILDALYAVASCKPQNITRNSEEAEKFSYLINCSFTWDHMAIDRETMAETYALLTSKGDFGYVDRDRNDLLQKDVYEGAKEANARGIGLECAAYVAYGFLLCAFSHNEIVDMVDRQAYTDKSNIKIETDADFEIMSNLWERFPHLAVTGRQR